MQAIIKSGGKQYLVEKGTKVRLETLEGKEGDKVTFETLLVTDGKEAGTQIGTPLLADAKVEGKILGQGRADKVRVFKMKAKKRYSKLRGHRQNFTEVEITSVK